MSAQTEQEIELSAKALLLQQNKTEINSLKGRDSAEAEPISSASPEVLDRSEDKPLMLEARHTLSIAETKKRRASVYSSESLFIPKELARSEISLRKKGRYTKFKAMNKNECSIRMLKFPVLSGRARLVARKLRQKQRPQLVGEFAFKMENNSGVKATGEQMIGFENNTDAKYTLSSPLLRSMPDLNAEINKSPTDGQLSSDDEISIVFFGIVKKESQELSPCENRLNNALEISKEEPSSHHDGIIKINNFSWHSPHCSDGEMKMGILKDLEKFIMQNHESNMETSTISLDGGEETAQDQVKAKEQQTENISDILYSILQTGQSQLDKDSQPTTSWTAKLQQQPPNVDQQEATVEQQTYLELQHQSTFFKEKEQYSPYSLRQQSNMEARSSVPINQSRDEPNLQVSNATILAELPTVAAIQTPCQSEIMQPVDYPVMYSNQMLQQSCDKGTENMPITNQQQQQLPETTYSPTVSSTRLSQNMPILQQQQQQLQQQHMQQQALQQQQLHQQQLQHRQLQEHQLQQKPQEQLQQLQVYYHRLKCHKHEQLKQLGARQTKICAEREECVRRHAEEKRLYVSQLEKFKRNEESLQAEKKRLETKIERKLNHFEQLMKQQFCQLQEQYRAQQYQQWRQSQDQYLLLQQHHKSMTLRPELNRSACVPQQPTEPPPWYQRPYQQWCSDLGTVIIPDQRPYNHPTFCPANCPGSFPSVPGLTQAAVAPSQCPPTPAHPQHLAPMTVESLPSFSQLNYIRQSNMGPPPTKSRLSTKPEPTLKPLHPLQPPPLQNQRKASGPVPTNNRIMRRRHTIDHRAHSDLLHLSQQSNHLQHQPTSQTPQLRALNLSTHISSPNDYFKRPDPTPQNGHTYGQRNIGPSMI
ncbi:putative uncharacterized protein DDB_G0268364 [Scaptodrosophila lebanonensis]|uniref:Uncharacterized protein n=1 Tax=Drosophila lebanonensis TaxID=7225 RepID=A0A6J2TAI7_DROLE|nr:putative uncharacterized protein DDB_G0268364 [Scaptodrosophila lebanonensis]